jgi:CRISPR/Cas system-associated exonuclease Cas4 (RecB family)
MDKPEAPQWSASTSISPSAIRAFRQCPHRAKLQYVDKFRVAEKYSLHLDKGRVAHEVLARQARLASAGKPLLSDDWTFDYAFNRLPVREFPSDGERRFHARDIAKWVNYGTRQLDLDAEFLYIEGYEKAKQHIDGNELYTISGKPDLVLLRTDVTGEQFIEFVDYKTGKPRPDEITPLLIRLIYSKAVRFRFGSTQAIRMRFVWMWLNQSYSDVVELDKDYYEVQWPLIAAELRSLVEERQWVATPSFLCNYCPFQGNHCDQGDGPWTSDYWD